MSEKEITLERETSLEQEITIDKESESVSGAFEKGFDEGKKVGFDDGYTAGYNNGNSDGYSKGQTDGYRDGYNKGKDDGYHNGKITGYSDGYIDGKSAGFEEGKTEGYNLGKADGIEEGKQQGTEEGRQAEKDEHWEVFQSQGSAKSYYYAFAYNRFNDETYNPKYDIVTNTSGNAAQNMFYNNTLITDTKVTIDVRNSNHIGAIFYGTKNLKTVRKFIVSENITSGGNNAFSNCESLENIVMEGINAQSLTFAVSPLTVDSMKSIISCLKDFSGTNKEGTCTIKFTSECWNRLEESGVSPSGTTWEEHVRNLGWLV